ncbi:MAG: nuoL, partial [Gammaproteobacteria bacterium]|nr:nuoL [Gammaproteobacteria bacterium]
MNPTLLIAIPLLPLLAAILAGLFGRVIGRAGAHTVTIAGVAIACALSIHVLKQLTLDGVPTYNASVYTWLISDGMHMDVGFLVDRLTALMMVVVTFVSLCVHVYTIGYMHDDPGYQRFFSYISLFTFSMLMLVMANNFMQLFFGWEAVGVVSYLLIGFWYTRPSAIFANMKAFLVNRIGDFGFVLGIAGIAYYTNSLSYSDAFAAAPKMAQALLPMTSTSSVEALTLICICLFIGAMGKSAQVPLHVWLPDSMEGPTPISALIHAATMVTAGIFMVARMSPLFEHSETALSYVLVIGATTAFFMGLLGIVNNDIKRVIAYSTLSQLGYMTVALGVSAYSAAIFHLMTHAFFKALLFLAAGSVIIGMHHEQDMRKMGGLAKYMPITALTSWIGALALIGTPFFSGFYSKDAIIEAVGESHRWGATYAYYCVLGGVFVTALYTFRMIFMTFHGPERFRQAQGHASAGETVGHEEEEEKPSAHGAQPAQLHGHDAAHAPALTDSHHAHHATRDSHGHGDDHAHGGTPHESPAVVTIPLIALAIPSLLIGFLTVGSVLFGNFFGDAIQVLEHNNVVAEIGREFHGPLEFALHGFVSPPFWFALAGVVTAWVFFLWKPSLAERAGQSLNWLRRLLVEKYYFDWF